MKKEYGESKLSNHLSHVLVVLCYLGATEEKIQDYYNKYIERLDKMPKPLEIEISDNNYKELVDNSESYPNLLKFFQNCIKKEGIEKTISI